MTRPPLSTPHPPRITFIGGGNMATALVGGLLRAGVAAEHITVVEPAAAAREPLAQRWGLRAVAAAQDAALADTTLLVWAVKPQAFAEAAAPCAGQVNAALHLSVMAGVRCDRMAAALGLAPASARIVRSMPNTPALIGRGIAGLYATPAVAAADRALAEQVLAASGSTLWVAHEADLDAVTALSGSGPAYVFYFIEAMVEAGTAMGLAPEAARRLAQETFAGAAALAMASEESPATLRERVTSKGGTTHAAICALDDAGVKAAFVQALHAARDRADALGRGG